MSIDKYKCMYCQKRYDNVNQAIECLDSHDIVYVPIARTDLSRLANFILTGNSRLLTENLTNILFRYFRKDE